MILTYELTAEHISALVGENAGACIAVAAMLNTDNTPKVQMALRKLLRFKITGNMIWAGYHDCCKEDAYRFISDINNMNPALFSYMIRAK